MIGKLIAKTVNSARKRFPGAKDGATAIEYGLISAGVALAVATTIWSLGEVVLVELYQKVAGAMADS
ncbi:MAG: Flp family type IVb pilin [Hyphomicrobiales bacterium]